MSRYAPPALRFRQQLTSRGGGLKHTAYHFGGRCAHAIAGDPVAAALEAALALRRSGRHLTLAALCRSWRALDRRPRCHVGNINNSTENDHEEW